jgi:alpha-tubulin suppressor-like RCC1 family protein
MDWSESFTITGHKIQSIASGLSHNVIVTTRGAIFRFGLNDNQQLGVVDPSALSDDIEVLEPTEVFAAVTKFK